MLAALRKASAARAQTTQHAPDDAATNAAPPTSPSLPLSANSAPTVTTPTLSAHDDAVCDHHDTGSQCMHHSGSCDSQASSFAGQTTNSGQANDFPRLYRPLPKRRRIHLLRDTDDADPAATVAPLNKLSSSKISQQMVAAVSAIAPGDAVSSTSSQGTGHATLYDQEAPTQAYSTPATVASQSSSSDDDEHARATFEKTLVEPDDHEPFDEEHSHFPKGHKVDLGNVKMPLKKHIDPGKRDRERGSAQPKSVAGEDADGTRDDANVQEEERSLGLDRQMGMLDLSDIEGLVKGVAVGHSFFGAAGLVAALAGMGLYGPAANAGSSQRQQALASLPAVSDPALNELAKLASWASCPIPIDSPPPQASLPVTTTAPRALTNVRETQRDLMNLAASGSFDGLLRNEPLEDADAETGNEYDDDGFEGSVETYADPGRRLPDAFDANDMERWTHQQEKLLAGVATGDSPRSRNNAVTGSSNTKKRKVPSLAHPSDTSASMSRKPSRTGKASVSPPVAGGSVVNGTSGQADPLGPWLARSALNNGQPGSAEFNRSTTILAQAINAITASIVGLSIVTRMKPGRVPTSSRTFQRYYHFRKRKNKRFPPAGTAPAQPKQLDAPVDLLPPEKTVRETRLRLIAPPPVTATSKKKKKAKPPSVAASASSLVTFPVPVLSNLSLQKVPLKSSFTSPMPSLARTQFEYRCGSERFAKELQMLLAQKRHLLHMLRTRRKEELLRKKVELEEEKERLSRVLAADLAAGRRTGGTSSTSQVAGDDGAAGKVPPKKGKKKRSAYANANNVHHRQNYVPSRLPATVPKKANEADEILTGPAVAAGLGDASVPVLTDASAFNMGADEWMCLFCEYELWYGSKPQLLGCLKKRKKVLKVRQKALDRAKGTIDGTAKKKAPAVGAATNKAITKSSAALPGTVQHQEKAENAKPTRAPPSTPTPADAIKPNASLDKAQTAAAPQPTPNGGVTQVALLAYHCLAKGLPQPVYTQVAYLASMHPLCDITIGDAVYVPAPVPDANVWNLTAFDKEDMAAKVLRGLLLQESLMPDENEALVSQGVMAIRKGQEYPIGFVHRVAGSYESNQDFLHDYCRVTWRTPPTFVVREEPDSVIPTVLLVIDGQVFSIDDNGSYLETVETPDPHDFEILLKEDLSLRWLERVAGCLSTVAPWPEPPRQFEDVD